MEKEDFITIRTETLKVSQKEISELLGVNKQTISNWERGIRKIPKTVEILLSYITNKSPSEDSIIASQQATIERLTKLLEQALNK